MQLCNYVTRSDNSHLLTNKFDELGLLPREKNTDIGPGTRRETFGIKLSIHDNLLFSRRKSGEIHTSERGSPFSFITTLATGFSRVKVAKYIHRVFLGLKVANFEQQKVFQIASGR